MKKLLGSMQLWRSSPQPSPLKHKDIGGQKGSKGL